MDKQAKIKTRQKFSALDLTAEINSIAKTLVDCKINTVYNLDNSTYLIKLGKVNVRANLLLQSGVRIQLLDNFVEKNEKPNGFTNKLRKHLRGAYVRSFEQIGSERVARLTVDAGDDPSKKQHFHLFIELYAKGNIVFTDNDLRILSLLRPHAYSETVKCLPGEIYPLAEAAKIYADKIVLGPEQLTPELIKDKATYGSLAGKLVPCAHQTLTDVTLSKHGLRPGDKYDAKNSARLLAAASDLLANYRLPDLSRGYLYFESGKENSFELSPVPLDFVSSPATALRRQGLREAIRQF